jgi:hypothetical protein
MESHDHPDLAYTGTKIETSFSNERNMTANGWQYFTLITLLLDTQEKEYKLELAGNYMR